MVKFFTPPKKGIITPGNTLEDLSQQKAAERMAKLIEVQEKRFGVIADELMKIVVKHSVTTEELPAIVSILTGKVNEKIDKATIGKILEL